MVAGRNSSALLLHDDCDSPPRNHNLGDRGRHTVVTHAVEANHIGAAHLAWRAANCATQGCQADLRLRDQYIGSQKKKKIQRL